MHIYAFGSICRGEITKESDIDLLAISSNTESAMDESTFSSYSYEKIRKLWNYGNPFAWHLHLESSMVFSSDGSNFLRDLGTPSAYTNAHYDCVSFIDLFEQAKKSIDSGSNSKTFELSTAFIAARNFAICYSLQNRKTPSFSRYSAKQLGSDSLDISDASFKTLERARLLASRGIGTEISEKDLAHAIGELPVIRLWMDKLMKGFTP